MGEKMAGGQSSISIWTAVKRIGCACLVVQTLAISRASYGAEKTISWENGAQCAFETRFDPAKYDEEKLRNTIEVIFGDGFYKQPSSTITLTGPGGHIESNAVEYKQACEREEEKVANLPVIDLPGINSFRKWSLEALRDFCRFDVLEQRAALQDPAALREFTPSVLKCSSFINALEGKADIRAAWRDVISSTCRKNSSPEECKVNFLKAERKPSSEDAIKLDVLMWGWNTCSTPYLKANNFRVRDSMLEALEKNFRRRFKVKAFPCAD